MMGRVIEQAGFQFFLPVFSGQLLNNSYLRVLYRIRVPWVPCLVPGFLYWVSRTSLKWPRSIFFSSVTRLVVCRPTFFVEPSLPSCRPGDISWMATMSALLALISAATRALRFTQCRLSQVALAVRTLKVAARTNGALALGGQAGRHGGPQGRERPARGARAVLVDGVTAGSTAAGPYRLRPRRAPGPARCSRYERRRRPGP